PPRPVPPHRPLPPEGSPVVRVTDENLPAPQPGRAGPPGVPPPPAYRVVLVGEETTPTPPRPRPSAPSPDGGAGTAGAPHGSRLLLVLALLVGPALLLLLVLCAGSITPDIGPGKGVVPVPARLPAIDPHTPLADL